jgi:hypothetical protein
MAILLALGFPDDPEPPLHRKTPKAMIDLAAVRQGGC